MSSNPRRANGTRRDRLRARVRSLGLPCALCGKPIDYSLSFVVDERTGRKRPHPMSYALDEIVPVSMGGSPFDLDNVQPTHWVCNAKKGNRIPRKIPAKGNARDSRALPRPFDDW